MRIVEASPVRRNDLRDFYLENKFSALGQQKLHLSTQLTHPGQSIMVQCVSVGYTREMEIQALRISIERELREKFLATCPEQDSPAAQVIREFMRTRINQNDNGQSARRKCAQC
jgi:hypothetical protein